MFPLMHIKMVKDITGYLTDELIVGSLLPDVLRLIGCDWSKSHQIAKVIGKTSEKCSDVVIGALLHGEDPPGVDYFSDVSFRGIPWGWAFYRAWNYINKYLYIRVPRGLMPWIFHNMVEASVDMFLYETWKREIISHIVDVYSWKVDWEKLAVMLERNGIFIQRDLKGAYVEYLSLSLSRYVTRKCFIKSLYEITRRKFYRHGISVNLPLALYREIWENIYGDRDMLYDEFVKESYPVIETTYKEWCV